MEKNSTPEPMNRACFASIAAASRMMQQQQPPCPGTCPVQLTNDLDVDWKGIMDQVERDLDGYVLVLHGIETSEVGPGEACGGGGSKPEEVD